MAFYIEPPKGHVSINHLEKWALNRLQLLLEIFCCHGDMEAVKELMTTPSAVDKSDCLIEGTTKDAVSHFILRLACCDDPLCAKVFTESETLLFSHRFTSLNEVELVRYLGSLRRFQTQLKKLVGSGNDFKLDRTVYMPNISSFSKDLYNFFKMLTENYRWNDLIHLYYVKSQKHFVKLPFKFALEMVAKREVTLTRGNALVPCIYLARLLGWFFRNWLDHGMKLAAYQHNLVVQDSRMKRIFSSCRLAIHRHIQAFDIGCGQKIFSSITAGDIDLLKKYFPPCMLHLHQSLRQNHRLKHFSRVAYLLFLKDLGLPVSEAVAFWKNEYTLPIPVNSSYHGCRHSWQKEKKRLTYSILHLYGLKGSRQKYGCHSCTYIQNHNWGPAEEAFCPFKHLDSLKLQRFLTSESLSAANSAEISVLVGKQKLGSACAAFLRVKVLQQMQTASVVDSATIQHKESCSDAITKCLSSDAKKETLNCCNGNLLDSKADRILCEFSEDLETFEPPSNSSLITSINQKRTFAFDPLPVKKFLKAECGVSAAKCLNSDVEQSCGGVRSDTKHLLQVNNIDNCNSVSLSSDNKTLAKDFHVDSGYEGSPYLCSMTVETDPQFDCSSVNQSASRGHKSNADISKKYDQLADKLSTMGSVKCSKPNSEVISGYCVSCNNCRSRNVDKDSNSVLNACELSKGNKTCIAENAELIDVCNSEFNYRPDPNVRKPIDYFRSYNDLIKEFRSASNFFLTQK